jgi:hypothetical protein
MPTSSRKDLWNRCFIYFKESYLLILILITIISLSCTPKEEIISYEENLRLGFSADTVLFDTVFTSVGNLTKRVKIFNRNKNAVNIKNLSLGRSSKSSYKIHVFGEEGYNFKDVYLLGGDSLMLLITVTIDPQDQDLPFLVKDSIVFTTNNLPQDIKLIAYGQDAHFLGNSILPCNTVWTAERPYLIYNSILVDSLCDLTIEKGAKIYFNNRAALYVKGSIKANGDPENKIYFENDRRDGVYKNAPGQWKGIYLLEGSKDNKLDHTVIRNAIHGLRIGTPDEDTIPDLYISNSVIENMSSAGLLSFTSDVLAYNVLINNCGDYTIGNFAGGNYTYDHCTFANFNHTFIRQDPSVVFSDNLVLADNSLLEEDLSINIRNSIIWGNLKDEVLLSHSGSALFIINTGYNIFRTTNSAFDINNNILNSSEINFPKFINPEEYNYRLDTLSPAKDAGKPSQIKKDLLGVPRDIKPDIGAFERVE